MECATIWSQLQTQTERRGAPIEKRRKGEAMREGNRKCECGVLEEEAITNKGCYVKLKKQGCKEFDSFLGCVLGVQGTGFEGVFWRCRVAWC